MYILKNAYISIKRNIGRNLLIGIVILVISCAATVSLAINNTSDKLISSYENKYEVQATIGINRENMMKDFNPQDKDSSKENMENIFSSINNIEVSDIESYANSKYVKSYYYTMEAGVNSDTIQKASMSSNNEKNDMKNPMGGSKEEFKNITSGDFTIKGYSSLSAMEEFIEGNYTITDGEVSEDLESNNCLINNELATLNNLNVGDTITVKDSSNESYTYDLVISGIYKQNKEENDNMSMFSGSVNTIITNTNVLLNMKSNNSEINIVTSPTFILKNKDVIEKFTSELYDKGLNENLNVETNLDEVASKTSTISNVKSFATTFLIITLIIGTIILLVINMINIRERKYEIGVLRTIGMKKKLVSIQFILELFIISFVFLMMGAGIGSAVSVPVSNSILQNEIKSSQSEQNSIRENFGKPSEGGSNMPEGNMFKSGSSIQAFDSINATVDLKVILELLLIGIFITLISSISALSSIQKFSPLTILKERS